MSLLQPSTQTNAAVPTRQPAIVHLTCHQKVIFAPWHEAASNLKPTHGNNHD